MKNRYFAFFSPSSQTQYFAVRAHEKKEVQLLIYSYSNFSNKPKEDEAWDIGEFTQSEIEDFLRFYENID